MTRLPSGPIDRLKVSQLHRPFCPIMKANSLQEIDLESLIASGKKLILLDVDNTLTKWQSHEIADVVLDWVQQAKNLGLNVALLSNTHRKSRLASLAETLDVSIVEGRMKPSRSMYLASLQKFQVQASEAIMIGDQILTDVFGANRSGIEAIWIEPLSDTEFIGTKINRWIESRVVLGILQALETPPTAALDAGEAARPFVKRTLFRQILRFCIVGGVSFAIDAGISILLESVVKIHGVLLSLIAGRWLKATFPFVFGAQTKPDHAAAAVFFWIAALVAMANSFYLNRLWTFELKGSQETARQLKRFFVITLIGTAINSLISAHFYTVIPGSKAESTAGAKAIAAIVVAAWNFIGQRFYAFRPGRTTPIESHQEASL